MVFAQRPDVPTEAVLGHMEAASGLVILPVLGGMAIDYWTLECCPFRNADAYGIAVVHRDGDVLTSTQHPAKRTSRLQEMSIGGSHETLDGTFRAPGS